jgi:2-succinyl-5-enolpyruvyl-6-hydroxy-3-cyclohexene-1-carboxylate synthase
MTMAPASLWAMHFLATLSKLGVVDVVVSPGSRSQAIALAAYDLSQRDDMVCDLHVAVDERTAGFMALGLSVQSGEPTVLVCTSGSAPSHYLPAIIEARHSGIPLLILSADRPARLQGVGANQTTSQDQMFGSLVSLSTTIDIDADVTVDRAVDTVVQCFSDALSSHENSRPGPVHLNVRVDEPLSSPLTAKDWNAALSAASQTEQPNLGERSRVLTVDAKPGTVVVAGHGAGGQAEDLAHQLGAPLIAEVHSGSHFGRNLVIAYRELLVNPPATISRVITVGRPTLSRQVHALLSRDDVEQIVWQQNECEPANPSKSATVVDRIDVGIAATSKQATAWVKPWVEASREIEAARSEQLDPPDPNVNLSAGSMKQRAEFARQEMEVVRRPLTRRSIAQEVWGSTWPHDFLVLGSSRMIREFDVAAPGKKVAVWSNRGVSGIDGTIATSRGISLGRAREGVTGVTRVVLGDVSFLHDAGSLLLDCGEESAWLQVIVVRDGGGSLFDRLEAKDTAAAEAYERVMFTPVEASLEHIAKGYGWSYRHAATAGELSEALLDQSRHVVIECTVPRAEAEERAS